MLLREISYAPDSMPNIMRSLLSFGFKITSLLPVTSLVPTGELFSLEFNSGLGELAGGLKII